MNLTERPMVRKRDGSTEPLDISKTIQILEVVNDETGEMKRDEIQEMALNVCSEPHPKSTREIRSSIEEELWKKGFLKSFKNFSAKKLVEDEADEIREFDLSVLSLINLSNKNLMTENANKDPVLVSTQRDLMAGEINKRLARKYLFSKDVMDAHSEGAIHVHDMDYSASPLTNCCLVNLEDVFKNGTVINEVMIEPPKSLRTAATIMSQISAVVASNQYGGQSMSLAHLAPFVDISRKKIRKKIKKSHEKFGVKLDKEQVEKLVEDELEAEIKDSVQTLNYQWSTLSSTNGQSPFVTLFIYLDEAKNKREKEDLVTLAAEVFRQRIQGFKSKHGNWTTPTFPKIVYVLDEENIKEDSEYYWLTELAVECVSKRMMPDFLSAKVMKRDKGGVWPPMGWCFQNYSPSKTW